MIARIMHGLNRKRAALKDGDQGFTLIELLVVVIIIGILAAVAIPIYIGVQNNATDSNTKTDLANAKTAVVAYQTSNGAFPDGKTSGQTLSVTDLGKYGFTLSASSGESIAYSPSAPASGATTFCLAATSPTSTTAKFWVTDSSGVTSTKPSTC